MDSEKGDYCHRRIVPLTQPLRLDQPRRRLGRSKRPMNRKAGGFPLGAAAKPHFLSFPASKALVVAAFHFTIPIELASSALVTSGSVQQASIRKCLPRCSPCIAQALRIKPFTLAGFLIPKVVTPLNESGLVELVGSGRHLVFCCHRHNWCLYRCQNLPEADECANLHCLC